MPTIVIPVGPMLVGHHKGEVLGACTDCRRLWGKYRAGDIDEVEIEEVNGRLAPTVGTCMVMGTASTMACIVEALGMALPMSATIPAPHAERFRLAEATGKVAAELAKAKGPKPSEILTKAAFRNALVVLQAIGGSTNGLIHLTAIANRTAHRIELEAFDKLGREVQVLVDLKPSGEHYMEHFHRAGGMPRLMAQLGDLRSRCQDRHGRDAYATWSQAPKRCRGRTSSARAKARSSRKAPWRCCTATSRRAAPSSSIRRRAPSCCSILAAPWCLNPSKT